MRAVPTRPLHAFLAALLLAAASPAAPPTPRATGFEALHGEAPSRSLVRVRAPAAELAAHHFDLARHGTEAPGEPVDVVVTPSERQRLLDLGYVPEEILTLDAGTLEDWSDLDEVQARIDALVAAHPDLLHPETVGTSLEGRPIVSVRVGGASHDPSKPQVAFNANHHAREVMTVEACLDILDQLSSRASSGETAALRWVSEVDTWVTPVVNPDGYAFVHSDDTWWRKNRRDNGDGSFGVDLNRNYPYAWGANDSGSSGNPWSQTYRGTGPASEPEAAAMVELARRVRPLFNLSFHSYGEVLLYPYGYENAQNPVGDVMPSLAAELASRLIKDTGSGHFGKRSRLYPVNGLDRDWYYFELGTYSFVPEISSSRRGFHPSYSWVDSTVEGLRGGWEYLLERSLGPGVRGRVVAGDTGAPLGGARVSVAGVVWRNEEPHGTSAAGWFHKLLEPGAHTVTVEADGYLPAELEVEVGDGLARVEVRLSPAPPPSAD